MLSMLLVWLGLGVYINAKEGEQAPPVPKKEGYENGTTVKSEPSESEAFDPASLEDMSDTSRTFPTLGRQAQPLHFSARGGGKKEQEDEGRIKREVDEVERLPSSILAAVGLGAEADDEDEDEGLGSEWRDSGIGTSREDERREEVRRRRKALMGSGAGR